MREKAQKRHPIRSCGKAHPWCAVCRPDLAAAQRKPKPKLKAHAKPCRDCGRCDDCLGIVAPEGMKYCRGCDETKSLAKFTRRTDTGGYRTQCNTCRNAGIETSKCGGCGARFTRHRNGSTFCASCRPIVKKQCSVCGGIFAGAMPWSRYCSTGCRDTATEEHRRKTRARMRMEALRAYSGPVPACACCGETTFAFLSLDHVNGGGGKHRKETGGGGFYSWLRRHNYPAGFRVLCHNCNQGRQVNGGRCPHEES